MKAPLDAKCRAELLLPGFIYSLGTHSGLQGRILVLTIPAGKDEQDNLEARSVFFITIKTLLNKNYSEPLCKSCY